jgi:hypothetical protein
MIDQLFLTLNKLFSCSSNSDQMKAWCTQATFAEDGGVIMSPAANVDHMSKSLLALSLFFLRQLPPHYNVQVDSEKFLNSISLRPNNDGPRMTVGTWPLGPGWINEDSSSAVGLLNDLVDNTGPGSLREHAIQRYKAYRTKLAKFIPWIVLQEQTVDNTTQNLGRPAGAFKKCLSLCL